MLFDFDGIVNEIQNRLSLLSDWRQTLFYGVYQRIIDAVAYAIDKLVYLTEFMYRESNWTSALKKRSLMLKSEYLGYSAHRKQAPNGSLIISGDSTGFFNNYTYTRETVVVNRWDQFADENSDSKVFCTEPVTYAKNAQTINRSLTAAWVTDEGGGYVGIPLSNTSSFESGDIVKIAGTSNYNGYHTIYSVVENERVIIPATYIAELMDGTEYIVVGLTFIPVKQGTPKVYTYTSAGDTNEIITLYSDSIDQDEFEIDIVDVDGNVISPVLICGVDVSETKMYFINDPNTYYCEIYNDYDFEKVYIKFGDDIYTKKLQSGIYVRIKYAETDGETGNITNTGVITTIIADLVDSTGNVPTLYVTNDEAISDGSEIEDIESIRLNAPNLFSTGYRAGGYYDWMNVLDAHPTIHNSIIWTTDDEADDTITQYQNKVYVSAISADGSELTESQKNDITINYLKDKKSPTEVISWQSPNIIYAMFKVTATIKTVNKSTIKDEVFTALDEIYGVLNTDFGTEVWESNFYYAIDNLDNIYYHTTELYNMEKLDSTTQANYPIAVYKESTEVATDAIILVPDTLEIWVVTKVDDVWQPPALVAYDNGGVWTAMAGYTLTSGNISYTLSQVTFVIGGITGVIDEDFKLYMAYKTQDDNGNRQNDIRFPSANYITDVIEEFILITNNNGESTLTYKVIT